MALSQRDWSSAAARRLVDAVGGGRTVEEAAALLSAELRSGVEGPPTDLGAVAKRLKVRRICAEPLPVTGELRRDDDGLSVIYASGLDRGRRRFTIAHELGHAFFEATGANTPRRGEELERISRLDCCRTTYAHRPDPQAMC